MRNLHELPKFEDRWDYLYLEHGRIDRDASSLLFLDAEGKIPVPVDQYAVLLLGPGTRITHAAMKTLAEANCLVCWTGGGVTRLYAHGSGGTHSSHRLLRQASLFADESLRLEVVRRMFQKRFTETLPPGLTLEQMRGMEGHRVRSVYRRLAGEYGVQWEGRAYDQENWSAGDPLNRSLSAANACLYGICHAGILSAGYSPAIGFIHTGKMLSFVYDVADLYKTDLTVPLAFSIAADDQMEVERRTRVACREVFHDFGLMKRILPDIAEVLDARDDLDERLGELEGRAVSLAR